LQTGRLKAAEEFVRQAAEAQPNAYAAQFTYGNILAALNKHEAALERYDRAIALDKNHAVAFNNRGTMLCRIGRNVEALESFTLALALDQNYRQAQDNLAAVRTELEDQSRPALAGAE
jgi:Tfp pilus assembly protein PilF